jgi:hypothetical protein
MRRLVCALTFALISPYSLSAEPLSDLDRVGKTLEVGQLVLLVDATGTEIPASFQALTSFGFEYRAATTVENSLRISGTVITLPADSVVSVVRFDRGIPGEEIYRRPGTFGALTHRLKLDMPVSVLEMSGVRTIGKVTSVSPESIVLDGHAFTPAGVRSIEKPAHLWDGALKGAAIAAATTLIIIASTCNYGCDGAYAFVLMPTGIGAAIGIGIDALVPPKKYYRAPK